MSKAGRYILGMNSHFVGLRIERDGSLFLTSTHRPCDNILISKDELGAMPWEAFFEISKCDGFAERLTEGSGGSHPSAGIALESCVRDIAGGSSSHNNAMNNIMLSTDLLASLPIYFFCDEYLATLATCSTYCRQQVLNRHHWSNYHLDLDTPRFSRNSSALRSMSRWWKAARSITLSQHQLTVLDAIPENCLLRWSVFDDPSQDEHSSGYRSTQSLLGCARFNITLPSHVRKLQVGVENPRGPEAFCVNIFELFTDRMSVSFRVIPVARAYAPRRASLPHGILRSDTDNQIMIMWDRRYFTAYVNNYILGPVSFDVETARGPPSQACPFVWVESARRARRRPEVIMRPMLSPVMPRAECTCRICLRAHWIESIALVACPVCFSWICREHITEMPNVECPGCPATLADYVGGSSRPLNSDAVNRILHFYNAASQGVAANPSLLRSCLGDNRIRAKIIAFCTPSIPCDFFWAESIAHSMNNCCTFSANCILRHPRPGRPCILCCPDSNADSC